MAKSPKLSIGLVFDDSLDRPDGVAQYVKTLGAWLSREGHEVSYLVGETKMAEWSGGKIYSLSKNKTVSFNGNKLTIPLPGSGRAIRRFMRGRHFDVIHVMVPYSPFMAAHVIKSAPDSTAIVGTFHIFPSGRVSVAGSKLLRIALGSTLKKFDEIVSVSRPAADFAKSGYRVSSEVIPNPVELSFFRQDKAPSEIKGQIVFLGRLVKRKGAAQLIDAFARLSRINPDARLLIAGAGPRRSVLEAKVRKLGLSAKVNFLGYIDEKDKPKILASSAVACFPSLYGESFGIVLIEAMAAGAGAVLAGDNPGYRSVLGKKPKLLIDPLDTAEFANRLNELLIDERERARIKSWQRQAVRQYDIDVVGGQITHLYKRRIARLRKNRHNKAHE